MIEQPVERGLVVIDDRARLPAHQIEDLISAETRAVLASSLPFREKADLVGRRLIALSNDYRKALFDIGVIAIQARTHQWHRAYPDQNASFHEWASSQFDLPAAVIAEGEKLVETTLILLEHKLDPRSAIDSWSPTLYDLVKRATRKHTNAVKELARHEEGYGALPQADRKQVDLHVLAAQEPLIQSQLAELVSLPEPVRRSELESALGVREKISITVIKPHWVGSNFRFVVNIDVNTLSEPEVEALCSGRVTYVAENDYGDIWPIGKLIASALEQEHDLYGEQGGDGTSPDK